MIEVQGRKKSLPYLQNDKNFCKIFEYVHSVNSLFIKRAEHQLTFLHTNIHISTIHHPPNG